MSANKSLSAKDMNGQRITNLGVGTANTTDAASTAQSEAVKSRATHTGTQLAATTTDFDTAVRLRRLDQLTAPTGPVAFGAQRLTSVADPTTGTDGANQQWVLAQIAALSGGLAFKGAARAATATNVNTASAQHHRWCDADSRRRVPAHWPNHW